jgi:hypothetical protein
MELSTLTSLTGCGGKNKRREEAMETHSMDFGLTVIS